ncbi:MAG: PEGA domain-containing protein [Salinibacter sp.]|uniref:PEGA domain-containing protein n=1 Tax=Salinibacter sp. TaxID=2065818 RepID=UPI0035D472F8
MAWLRRYSFSIVAVLVIIGFGALLYFTPKRGFRASVYGGEGQNASTPVAEQSGGGSGPRRAALSVYSEPTGALVIIEDDTVGTTPIDGHRLQSGVYAVAVAKENYSSQDTVLALRSDESAVYWPQLTRAGVEDGAPRETQTRSARATRTRRSSSDEPPESRTSPSAQQEQAAEQSAPGVASRNRQNQQTDAAGSSGEDDADSSAVARPIGALRLRADPDSTAVELNAEPVGRTPLRLDSVPAGTHEVTFARSGYEALTRQVDVQAGEETIVNVSLDARTGYLRVLVRPWGSIYVDQQRRARNVDVWYEAKLPGGTHNVSARHPSLGRKTRTIRVPPGDTLSVVFNMQEE